MSQFATASNNTRYDRRVRNLRRGAPVAARTPVAPLPWRAIAIAAPDTSFSGGGLRKPPTYVWVLTALAVALHGAGSWYATHHQSHPTTKPHKAQVAVEFVRPPDPPKIEPPKPPPPKPLAKQLPPPPTAPPLQTATPEPSNLPSESVGEPVAPVVEGPPAPPAPPAPVTAAFGRAGYLNNPSPDYPSFASDQGWEGNVLLRVRVLATGKVEKIEVQKSSGHKVLDDEAVRTVRNWSFSPSKRGDEAIDGWASVPIEFKLDA